MAHFKGYAGLFAEQGDFDIPINWTAGLALKPSDRVTIAFDVQEICYSKIESIGNPLLPNLMQAPLGADGGAGFGWMDVTLYKAGWAWVAAVRAGRSGTLGRGRPLTTRARPPGHADSHLSLDRRLWLGVGLNVLITAAEVVGGLASGSLALLSDALHNASDVAALLLAIGARALGRQAPSRYFSYGYRRVEVVAALVNAALLVGLAVLVGREAVERLRHPAAVAGPTMLAVALFAFAANGVAVLLLGRHDYDDLNVRSAFLHLVQDALSSLVVVLVALLAGTRAGPILDPAVSLLIGAAVVVSAGRLIWESVRILVEAAPSGLDVAELTADLDAAFAPSRFHHVHAWTVGPGQVALTAHVRVESGSLEDVERQLAAIRKLLAERWDIHHATLEPERDQCSGDDVPERWIAR